MTFHKSKFSPVWWMSKAQASCKSRLTVLICFSSTLWLLCAVVASTPPLSLFSSYSIQGIKTTLNIHKNRAEESVKLEQQALRRRRQKRYRRFFNSHLNRRFLINSDATYETRSSPFDVVSLRNKGMQKGVENSLKKSST